MDIPSEPATRHRCLSQCGYHLASETSPLLQNESYSHALYSSVNGEQGHIMGHTDTTADGTTNLTGSGSGQHCHGRESSVERLDKAAMRKLVIAIVLCLVFMVAEIVGGVLSNSLAIATDAAHLLTDLISFLISLFAVYIGSRAPTKRMSFGYYRAEVMGALVSVLLIWVVTGVLVYLAIERVITGKYDINAEIMLITSALAIVFNLIMGCSLGHNHSHAGAHAHSEPASAGESSSDEEPVLSSHIESGDAGAGTKKAKKHGHSHGQNINVRAALIHVIGDFFQSVGIFVAALVIYFKPDWKIADPICTFLFSVLVIITTLTILKDTLHVLMEGTPRGVNFNDVKRILLGIEGVREVHNLRIWSLTVNKCALAVHLALDKSVNAQQVVAVSSRLMREQYGIQECTVQVEDYVEEMMDCTQCQDPRD